MRNDCGRDDEPLFRWMLREYNEVIAVVLLFIGLMTAIGVLGILIAIAVRIAP